MTTRGLLIAIEGIDGSGKHTQAKLLEHSLVSQGLFRFCYGIPAVRFLVRQHGGKIPEWRLRAIAVRLIRISPRCSMPAIVLKRNQRLESVLNEGKIVLVDRYVSSNLAHQVARASAEKRSEFLRWIEHLEYSIYGLPREDLILYLRVPPSQAQRLVGSEIGTQIHARNSRHSGEKSAAPGRRRGNV